MYRKWSIWNEEDNDWKKNAMIDAHDSSKHKVTSQMGPRLPQETFSGLGFHKVSGILMIKNYKNCE